MLEFIAEQPPLFWLAVLFALLACAAVPAYLLVLRPRAGTTEWMRRIDPPHFAPLAAQALGWGDMLWALLAVLFAAGLRVVGRILSGGLRHTENPEALLGESTRQLLGELFFCAIFAAVVYLLLKLLFGRPFPALLCAGVGGILPNPEPEAAALLACSLLCLYLWASAPPDGTLALDTLRLALCGLSYAAALLFCWEAIWFAPFYLGVYLFSLVRRWRHGESGHRGKRLATCLCLTLLMLAFGAVFLWLAYCMLCGAVADPADALSSPDFYAALFPALAEKLARLFRDIPGFGAPQPQKIIRVAVCAFCAVPALHGAIALRESRCLFLLGLLPCALCAWLLGGAALLTLPILLAVGWTWYLYVERSRPAYAVFCACAAALYYGAELFLTA